MDIRKICALLRFEIIKEDLEKLSITTKKARACYIIFPRFIPISSNDHSCIQQMKLKIDKHLICWFILNTFFVEILNIINSAVKRIKYSTRLITDIIKRTQRRFITSIDCIYKIMIAIKIVICNIRSCNICVNSSLNIFILCKRLKLYKQKSLIINRNVGIIDHMK